MKSLPKRSSVWNDARRFGGTFGLPLALVTGWLLFPSAANATVSGDPLEDLVRQFYERLSPAFRDAVPTGPRGGTPERQRSQIGATSRLDDGSEVLLTIRTERERFVEPLLVLTDGPGFRVALGQLIDIFDFPINLDEAAGTAEGWFIRPANRFTLNLAQGVVTSRGQSIPINPGDITREGVTLLIGDWVLKDWFGLDVTLNWSDLEVIIASAEPLPAEQRRQREQRFARRQVITAAKPELPPAPDPPPLIGPSVADLLVSARMSQTRGSTTSFGANYAISTAADFLKGSFAGFVSGDNRSPVASARGSLTYFDPDGLAGMPWLTQASLGDVTIGSGTLLQPASAGHGAYFSNLPVGGQIRTDSTLISGNALPGYDVELYRGGQLIGFQRVGENGLYEFPDVELFSGENRFRIVLYGPQGQVEEVLRNVPAVEAFGGLPFAYELTASRIAGGKDDGALQAGLSLRQGVTGWLGLVSGLGTTVVDDRRINDALLGAQFRSGPVGGELLAGRDSDGRSAARASVQAQLGTASLRLNHFTLPQNLPSDRSDADFTERRSEAALTGVLSQPFGLLPHLRYTLGVEQRSNARFEDSLMVASRLGTQISRMAVNTDAVWSRVRTRATEGIPSVENTDLRISHQAFLALGPSRTRLRVSYTGLPEFVLNDVDASFSWRFSQDLTTDLDVRHSFDPRRTSAQARLSYDLGALTLAPRVSVDDRGTLGAFVDLRMSLGVDPITDRVHMQSRPLSNDGSVAVVVFIDEDGDGQPGPDEERLSGIEIQASQVRRSAVTGPEGVAILRNVPPYQVTDVRLAPSSLPDTSLVAALPGFSTGLRPGGVQTMAIPVERVWSVEGRAWTALPGGAFRPLSGARVLLLDGDSGAVVASTGTAGDGYYAFQEIRQGTYRVELAEESLAGARLTAGPGRHLRTDRRVTTFDAVDLVAAASGVTATYPPLEPTNTRTAFTPLAPVAASTDDGGPAGRPVITIRLDQFRSRLALVLGWAELLDETGPLLGKLLPILSEREEARILAERQSLYPLRLGPLPDRDTAEAICDILRSTGRPCVPTLVMIH